MRMVRVIAAFALVVCLVAVSFSPAHAHARFDPHTVDYRTDAAPGTVVVSTDERRLYLVLGDGKARVYPIAVGKAALVWKGTARVGRKAKWPRWQPTKDMIRREPHKYARYADGVEGGPDNPLGARALYLYRGKRDTMYRIHGTNNPASIGTASSNGCVRLTNDHVIDLYDRVPVGATVVVQ